MCILIYMKNTFVYIAFVICIANTVLACHNSTGSCTTNSFICASGEEVPHSMRCNDVEDCADGTDEYMCSHSPTTFQSRLADIEASCIKCTCYKGMITIPSTNTAWFTIAMNAPRDFNMMTDAPAENNKPCSPTFTTSIELNVYKKKNKGCRGWVCCLRQTSCSVCSGGKTTALHCYA